MKDKIELNEWEECPEEETFILEDEEFGIFTKGNKSYFLKQKQKFPIVFESDGFCFEVDKSGNLKIGVYNFDVDNEIKAGFEAFKKAMEIRGLKE